MFKNNTIEILGIQHFSFVSCIYNTAKIETRFSFLILSLLMLDFSLELTIFFPIDVSLVSRSCHPN